MAYNTAEQPEKAVVVFEALLREQPDNPSILLNMGYAYQDSGFTEMAVKCFRKVAVTTAPDTSYVRKAQQAINKIRSTDA